MPKVLVTGASGLLGRAVCKEFTKQSWDVLGFAFSRATGNLIKINLEDSEAVKNAINKIRPDVIVHCAAQRFPDKVEQCYEATQALNIVCSKYLAEIAGEIHAAFLYISTDYVFDGKNPPYKETDSPCPINKYGLTKFEGEKEVLKVNEDCCILRIPVIYGDEEYIGESAISCLLKILLKSPAEETKVSNFEIRYPCFTGDIASICYQLMKKKIEEPGINGIFHWCGEDALTKYAMIKILAEKFCLPCSHVTAENEAPTDASTCLRPLNTQLSCERLINLGIGEHTKFVDGISCFQTLLDV